MSIIKPTCGSKKKLVKIKLCECLFDEIQKYCEWAKIQNMDDFFEQSAQYVLDKDKDWKKKNKQ